MIGDVDGLRDDQWKRLEEFVPGGRKGKRGRRADNRRFLNALLWMARSGGRWRDLPERLGDYETVKRRSYRWIEMGVLDDILSALAREADLEADDRQNHRAGTSAGSRRPPGKRGRMPKAFTRSRGGLSSPGQSNDIALAHGLIEGFVADVPIADKGYDADHLCDRIAETADSLSSRPSEIGRSNGFTTPNSTRSATSSSASSTNSSSSAASRPVMTSCSQTSSASSNSPLSQSGSNR